MITSIFETAQQYERTAAKYRRQAVAEAKRADSFYASAYLSRSTARLVSGLSGNSADHDRNAALMTRCADMYLVASFNATEHARFYAELARDYRRMAA